MSEALKEELAQGIVALGLSLEPADQERMLAFVALLAKWNQVYNLTAVGEPMQMLRRHILDSLVIAPYIKPPLVLDVGTGGGLPGIPLALALGKCEFTLLDSNSKKTRFITQVVSELGLSNVNVVHSRLEEYRPEQGFNTLVSRAFSSIKVFVSASQHVCAKGGIFLAMKGAHPTEELGELDQLPPGLVLKSLHPLVVPGLDAQRHLAVIQRA